VQPVGLDVEQRHVVATRVDCEQLAAVGRDRERCLASQASGSDAGAARVDSLLLCERPAVVTGERDDVVARGVVRLDVHVARRCGRCGGRGDDGDERRQREEHGQPT
jgi:hypothetical protein